MARWFSALGEVESSGDGMGAWMADGGGSTIWMISLNALICEYNRLLRVFG